MKPRDLEEFYKYSRGLPALRLRESWHVTPRTLAPVTVAVVKDIADPATLVGWDIKCGKRRNKH